MKNYYVKQIDKIGKIKVFIVDGFIIRRDLDEEFTNFGQHYSFGYIPKYEFWIDKEASPDERKLFTDRLMNEWKLMKKAYEEAVKKDKLERKKFRKEDKDKKFHIKLIKKIKDDVEIWKIDGKLVRDMLDIDFVEGGHEFVYNYVPKNEVWIDNDITTKERKFVILHELFERALMKKGSDYDNAHIKASEIEKELRLNPKKINDELKKLGW